MRNFEKNELFCKNCFVHDTFFVDGSCPACNGTEQVVYGALTHLRRSKVRDKFKAMDEKGKDGRAA
jgi:hypothetical protein